MQWVERLRALTGWRQLAAAFFVGALSVLALSPFDLWPVLFVTLPVLVLLLDAVVAAEKDDGWRRARRAFNVGWAFGFGYFTFGLYWIGKAFLVEAGVFAVMMPFAMTAMPAGLALFHGVAAIVTALMWRSGPQRLFAFAVPFAVADWLRGHLFTGFPWNLFGQVFIAEPGLSQLFALIGPYALSLVALLLFATPVLLADPRPQAPWHRDIRRLPLAGAALLLLAAAGWGHYRLASEQTMLTDVQLRIVQPNIEQTEKWKSGNAGPIYRLMLEMSATPTAERPAGLAGVSHLIWPETALPFFMDRSQEALQGIDDLLPDNVDLVTGALRYETVGTGEAARNLVYNSLLVLDDRAGIVRIFDKKHLVPFGEYLPFQPLLESLGLEQLTRIRGGFAEGNAHRLVQMGRTPAFSPLICYEVVFPGEVVESGERPGWLVNVTNDAWYGVSTGPYQHLAQSRMRAIETGLPLVRAANTGISAIIDPHGRILRSLPLASKGVIDAALPAAIEPTPYARYGDLGFLLLLALALAAVRAPIAAPTAG